MELSKIKNVVIIVLLTVNIIFLTLFFIGRAETNRIDKQAKEDIVKIMAANGISLDSSVIPKSGGLISYSVARDTSEERFIAETLLGETEFFELGGNIFRYKSALGEAIFRGNGNFSVSFTEEVELDSSISSMVAYLKKINIVVDPQSVETVDSENNISLVTFLSTFEETRIFSCRITFEYEKGLLTSISGRRLMSSPQPSSDNSPMIGVYTALLNFLHMINSSDIICNEISAITAGYKLNASISGEGRLTPVWSIETDTGKYYIDGLTGEISSVLD